MPTARRTPVCSTASSRRLVARRPTILPGNGIAIAEDGQQTASGISLIGVAQLPTCPVESFTPVKNRPITARSTTMSSSPSPNSSRTMPTVFSRIVSVTTAPPSGNQNLCLSAPNGPRSAPAGAVYPPVVPSVLDAEQTRPRPPWPEATSPPAACGDRSETTGAPLFHCLRHLRRGAGTDGRRSPSARRDDLPHDRFSFGSGSGADLPPSERSALILS